MKQPVIFLKLLGMFILSLCSSFSLFSQQVLVNREWSTADSTSYFFQKSIVKTDANGLIYTLGSKMTATNGYDFLLLKQKSNGDTVYIASFDGDASKDDFAADLFIAPSGSVYIVGASWQNSSDSLDPVIVKLSSTGAFVWRDYLTNSSSYGDALVSITSDGGDKIFAGGTVSNGTDQDYILAKYDTSGTSYFEVTYDNNFQDIGVRVQYDAINSVIHLLGASQPTDTTWDFCIRRYNPSTGTALKTYRSAGGTIGIDVVSGIEQSNGNYFITGSAKNTSTGYDMVAICLDDSLDLLWTHTWNGADSLDDKSNAIRLDGNGNVYISGYTTTSSRGRDMILQKLDKSTGSVIWQRMLNGPDDGHDSGTDIEINGTDVFVTGYTTNGDQVFSTECYDIYGSLRWQKMSNTGVFGIIPDMAVDVEGNPVIGVAVFGLLYVEKYKQLVDPLTPVTDTSGLPLYEDNKLLITFNPDKVSHSFVDDPDIVFAPIENVIDSTLISIMESKLGVVIRKFNVIKTVSQKTTDTISISRHGYEVPIPKFWATLAVQIPGTLDELAACDSLKTISDIYNSELNVAFTLMGSDDPYFISGDGQSSLHPTATYPNAHINIDTAWARTTGKSYIKVGILDNGIWFPHQDFGNATNGSLSGSKIAGGYNYVTSSPNIQNLLTAPGLYNHGTAVSGIIGALRNNTTGIAGIAGGDPDSSSTGVPLYDMIVCCPFSSSSSAYVNSLGAALYDGSVSGPNSYNGLHIINMSLGTSSSYANAFLRQRILFARDNGVVLVAARGTKNTLDSTLIYPAVYNDEWILNVGGSGTDGHFKNGIIGLQNGNGNGYFGSNNQNLYTLIGKNIDFTAPQAYENVTTLEDGSPNNSYTSFGATSSSTAHVSGVAALMLSYFNSNSSSDQNLTIEDVEHILEYTATDDILSGYSTVGYDIYSGHGRINGGKALQVLQKPYYQVLHFTAWLDNSDMTQVGTITTGSTLNDYNGGNIPLPYPTNVYRISGTVNHGNLISPNAQILGYWIRNTYTDSWDSVFTVSGTPNINAYRSCDFEYFTTDSAKLYGYLYYSSGLTAWFPYNPNTNLVRLSYTVHVYDSTGQTNVEEITSIPDAQLYPNPSRDFVNLQLTLPQSGKVNVRILDMSGKVIADYFNQVVEGGYHIIPISVQSWKAGMYFFEIQIDNKRTVKKFIKTE